jgi:alpha-L-fucosidase
VHVYAWPYKFIHLKGLGGKVDFARFLHDGSEVGIQMPEWESHHLNPQPDSLILSLPIQKPDVVVPVIELTLND